MKRTSILAAMILVAFASCNKADDSCGNVSFALESNADIVEVTRSTAGDYTTLPAASSFSIEIKNGSSSVWTGRISDYDPATSLKAGNYSVDATYGTEGEEGFDKPYFTGSQSFAVIGGQTTSVSIPVKLGNALVKIACTDMFKSYFPDYSFTVTTGSGTVIPFPMGETRAAFIEAYKFTVTGTLTTQTSKTVNVSKEYQGSIEAATCYTVRFDVNNVGGLKVSVSFNDSLETIDLGDVELND